MVAVQPTADAMHIAAVHSAIQKQIQEQKRQAHQLQQPPSLMITSDRYQH